MIRVLIADDSPLPRQLTRAILESDPELQVVGEAGNGREAIALCDQLQPDIIIMGIRPGQVDGYPAIRRIMAESPRPIVVLSDPQSSRELTAGFKALEAGALMVLGKPHGLPDTEANQLITQVKAMAEVKVVRRRWWLFNESANQQSKIENRQSKIEVRLIAIGASAGGPLALQFIFSQLPAELPVPIVVVQHISRGFVDGLAHWLNDTTPLQVKVAQDSEILRPGMVYLAPDDQHLLVARNELVRLEASPPVDGHRPSVTMLFESAAQNYGPAAVGVLLTGMGSDGALGLKALYDVGGYTIAQDKTTSAVFGMPQKGIALGVAQEVSPLDQIGLRLNMLALGLKEQR